MKRTPTLTFSYDEAVETGLRISALLEEEPGAEDPETEAGGAEAGEPEGTG